MDTHVHAQSPQQGQAETDNPASSLAPPAVQDPDARARKKARIAQLRALSKTYGHIPGVPIFAQWNNRLNCSNSAVHRSVMAGICGNGRDGAYSIALSGLYPDDEDKGDVIIYTGAGGRKQWTDTCPPKRLRCGPQVFDQSWDHPSNRALIVSSLTRNHVRVIRSAGLPSQYAPISGYRYDGLYTITDVWTATGHNKKKICQCRLERLTDQPLIPVRPITMSTSRKKRTRLVPQHSPSVGPSDASEGTEGRDGPNPSTARLAGSTAGTGCERSDCVPGDESDAAHAQPQHPGTMPRYRWDAKTNQLIRIPVRPISEIPSAPEGAEERPSRGEDEVTLVQSEDGIEAVPANERMGTEYFSDRGNSPQSVTQDSDELGTSGGSESNEMLCN